MTAPLDPIPPPTGALALETFELTKRFGAFTAMDSVTMKVAAGSVHALLGENGAGKSTLVKCVAGSQRPDGGSIVVDGREREIATPVTARALGQSISAGVRPPARSRFSATLMLGASVKCW